MNRILVLYSDRPFTPWKENIDSSVIWQTVRALERKANVAVAHYTTGRDFASFIGTFDLVFNLCYGYKSLSQIDVVRMLEILGAKHTSSDHAAQSRANDKRHYPELCAGLGIRTPRIFSKGSLARASMNGDLLIMKPRRGACHRDVRIGVQAEIRSAAGLAASDMIVQEYVPGREFSVAVIPNEAGNGYEVLPPVEVRSRDHIYVAGNRIGRSNKDFAPKLEPELLERLNETTLAAHSGFGLLGYSRIDYRVNADNEIYLLDVNPMPNLHPKHSFLPNMSRRSGIRYDQLVNRILDWFVRHYEAQKPNTLSAVAG